MSTLYYVHEEMNIRNIRSNELLEDAAIKTRHQIAQVISLLLENRANFRDFSLTLDGKQYSFTGIVPAVRVMNAIRKMDNADSLELKTTFEYWQSCYEECIPDNLCAFFDISEKGPRQLNITNGGETGSPEMRLPE